MSDSHTELYEEDSRIPFEHRCMGDSRLVGSASPLCLVSVDGHGARQVVIHVVGSCGRYSLPHHYGYDEPGSLTVVARSVLGYNQYLLFYTTAPQDLQ